VSNFTVYGEDASLLPLAELIPSCTDGTQSTRDAGSRTRNWSLRTIRSRDVASPSQQQLKGLRLLVVEDMHDAQETTRAMLERVGADVLTAQDGIEALDVMRHEHTFPDAAPPSSPYPGSSSTHGSGWLCDPPRQAVRRYRPSRCRRHSNRARALEAGPLSSGRPTSGIRLESEPLSARARNVWPIVRLCQMMSSDGFRR
jgi:CheY-like chemotaxis protein